MEVGSGRKQISLKSWIPPRLLLIVPLWAQLWRGQKDRLRQIDKGPAWPSE